MGEAYIVTVHRNDEDSFVDSVWTSEDAANERAHRAQHGFYADAELLVDAYPLNRDPDG